MLQIIQKRNPEVSDDQTQVAISQVIQKGLSQKQTRSYTEDQ